MFARVATYSGDADDLARSFEAACTYQEGAEGFVGAYCCVNRSRAKGLVMTLWETEDALDATAIPADTLRSWATETAGAKTDFVMDYEVIVVREKAAGGAR